jgi:hypothetical protein
MNDIGRGWGKKLEVKLEFLRQILRFRIRRCDNRYRAILDKDCPGYGQRFGPAGRSSQSEYTPAFFNFFLQFPQRVAPHRSFKHLLQSDHVSCKVLTADLHGSCGAIRHRLSESAV